MLTPWRRAIAVAAVVLSAGVLAVGIPTAVGQSVSGDSVNLTDVYTTETADGYREVRDMVPTDDGGLMALVVEGADAAETTVLRIDGAGNPAGEETIPGRYDSIARVDNDSYAAAGTRGGTALLTRIHEDGWVQWTERFGGNGTEVATDVVSAPAGDAYLLASTESVDNETSDLWVLRVDDEGEVRWDRVVEHETRTAFPRGERLPDGSLIAAIQTRQSVDGEVDGDHNVSTARLAPNGTVVWRTELSGADGSATVEAFDAVPAHDGGVLLVGTSGAETDASSADVWAAQLETDGAVGWQRRYDSERASVAQGAVRTTEGYVLAGGTRDADGVVQGQLLVIDAAGDEQLRRTTTRNATGLTRIQSAAWTGTERLAVGGLSAVETGGTRQSTAWVALVEGELGVDPGPSTWETQHSEAERAGERPAIEDSANHIVLFAATAVSVGLLVVPYGLRRLRRRR